jgi:hypothetical protein
MNRTYLYDYDQIPPDPRPDSDGCDRAILEVPDPMSGPAPDLIVTAPNGITWKRRSGGVNSGPEFLAALATLTDTGGRIAREWNWWQEGRRAREDERIREVVRQWDHAEPPPGGYLTAEQLKARLDASQAERDRARQARAAQYDEDLAMARLRLLSAQATSGFMRHVLARPVTAAQQDGAEELLAASEQEAADLAAQVGDPDAIPDLHGDLPAGRRERHLDEHMTFFRHRLLRQWSSGPQHRFRPLLAMPAPQAADMCSECQAPADWHTYALSLRLWPGTPEPGSTAAKLAALMPGWWERCPACTSYQIRHQWSGTGTLPGFDGTQWQAMLTPVLRAIFAPAPPAPRKKPDQHAVLQQRLRAAETEAERLRRQLAALTPDDEPAP